MLYKEDWDDAMRRFEAWWEGEVIDRVLIQVTAPRKKPVREVKPLPRPEGLKTEGLGWILAACVDLWGPDPERIDLEFVLNRYELHFSNTYFGGESFPQIWLNLGPGVLATYLTGYWLFRTDTVWFRVPNPMSWEEIEGLDYDPENPYLKVTKWMAEELSKAGEGKFLVGTTDIGGILDVLASLRHTENLLIDLRESPNEVLKASNKIARIWHRCYDELHEIITSHQHGSCAWMGLWSPLKWYPIQCDFAYMISPQDFKTFAVPGLGFHCRMLDHPVYHWDGVGQIPHLDHLLEIPNLRGIQWVPGAGNPGVDEEVWFPLYKRIQAAGKNLVLNGVRPERIEKLLSELKPEGLLISTWARSQEEAEELLKKAAKWSSRKNRS